ncbi:MAG: trypsin-like peptidase domain-containing protein [Solirubrobacterales bacterium]|nr:trypsin-like peptidase domain-containing protein [Solirubrobacterales bacterium]HRV59349.1 trypsin-like peptidase domain-containing protein [Solirubrobacterales bacterium]
MSKRLTALLLIALLGVFALSGCGSDSGSDQDQGSGSNQDTQKIATSDADPVVVDSNGSEFNPSKVYSETIDGVVSIRSVFGDVKNSPATAAIAGGAGFVLSKDGEIVTNAHVISDGSGDNRKPADNVYVEFTSGDILDAEIVGFDPFADVGLLKVSTDEVDMKPLVLADSDKVVVGQPIAVIGSPFGEDQTLTTGVVSQTGRSVMSLTDFQIEGAIQTDASINPGNSGGPMLDGDGHVIGISQQMKSGSGSSDGVGFGVPANSIRHSVEMLRDGGEPEYAYIGVSTQPLYPQLAEKLGIDADQGAIVAEVVKGGPADDAGIKGSDRELIFQGATYDVGGDVIVAVNDVPIEHAEDLGRMVGALKPGDTATLELIRDGEHKTIDVKLENRPTAVTRP